MKYCLTSQSANGLKGGRVKPKCTVAPSPRWKVINEKLRKSWRRGRSRMDSQRCHFNVQAELASLGGSGGGTGRMAPQSHQEASVWPVEPFVPASPPAVHPVSVLLLGSPPSCQENRSPRFHLQSSVLPTSLITNRTASWAVPAARSSMVSFSALVPQL